MSSDPCDFPALPVGEFLRRAGFQLPREQRTELRRPGSLSRHMQRWCDGALPVTVVRQGHSLPTRDEARLLGLKAREGVWVREVRLGPPDQPWINGRTVAALKEMRGPMHALRNLGDRPLGSVLFSGRGWRRSPFLLGILMTGPVALDTDPAAHGILPARRSVFRHNGNRLLVTEGFYPAYWRRLGQEQQPDRNIENNHRAWNNHNVQKNHSGGSLRARASAVLTTVRP